MLPKSLTLTDEILSKELLERVGDEINEYLAETYGYCNSGYGYEIKIDIDNIIWDTED